MKDLSGIWFRLLPLLFCALLLVPYAGCEKRKVAVELDAETQRELEEFERELEQSNDALRMANKYRSHIDPASKDVTATALENGGGSLDAPDLIQSESPQFSVSDDSQETPEEDAADFAPEIEESDIELADNNGSPNFVSSDEPPQSTTIPGFKPENNLSMNTVVEIADHSIDEETAFSAERAERESTDSPPESRLSKFSPPETVCKEFLGALENGDHIAASQMLTNIAQIETARANLQLESPGVQGSTWEVLAAEYATTEKQHAQVSCKLNQPGLSSPVELTWMMRFQYNGWKIYGMSIQLGQTNSVDLLSFENPKDLRRIQNSVAENDPEMTASQFSESVDR